MACHVPVSYTHLDVYKRQEETFGAGGTLGRETKGEVVLVERLKVALSKFNCKLPPEAIQTAIDELTRDRSAMSLEAANREVYRLLKEGITVSVPDREHGGQSGGQCTERLRVVDWEHPENNDFLLVSQFSVTGALYTCRPDLVGFVNGLPWVVTVSYTHLDVYKRQSYTSGFLKWTFPHTSPVLPNRRSRKRT